MNEKLQQELDDLRRRGIEVQKWCEFARSQYGSMLRQRLLGKLDEIRQSYGRVDLRESGHDLTLAHIQARESETIEMLEFLNGVEKNKISVDKMIQECELRIEQLNSATNRRSEDLIEPSAGATK